MDVSIIIVNYNTCSLTTQCIESIYNETFNIDFEIIMVDNASSDNTVSLIKSKYPLVNIIESSINLGFGRANNLGVSRAKGKYLFLLNSDTILIGNVVKYFFDYLEKHQEIASCGGNLLDNNGVNTISHGRFPSLYQEFSDIGFYLFYKKKYKKMLSIAQKIDEGVIGNIDYISGADIFIRREVFEKMKGFDENIFMYFEETDLFYRMSKANLKSCLLPYACIVHLEGGSFSKSKNTISIKRTELLYKSKAYFYRKNYSELKTIFMKIFSIISVLTHIYIYKTKVFRVISIIVKS